jgi:hypothetical protein
MGGALGSLDVIYAKPNAIGIAEVELTMRICRNVMKNGRCVSSRF